MTSYSLGYVRFSSIDLISVHFDVILKSRVDPWS